MDKTELKDEIVFIKKVIEDSKRTISSNNLDAIIWGVIVVIGVVFTYLHNVAILAVHIGWVWTILIGMGWIFSIISIIHKRKRPSVKTFGGRILISVWLTAGIVLTIFGFYAPIIGVIRSWTIIPISCLILGMGYYITSDILDNRITKLFAILWWIGGLVMMKWTGPFIYLVFGMMIILFHIIPSIKYQLEWKRKEMGMGK